MRTLKRILLVLGVLAALPAAAGAYVYATTFLPASPLPPTGPIGGGAATLIVDAGYVAAYLVPVSGDQGGHHVIAIDCGKDPEAAAIRRVLEDQKLILDAIFVTHGHPDHVGGCAALGAPVIALDAEVAGIAGEVGYQGPIPRLAGPHHLNVKVHKPVRDGDDVKVGTTSVRVHGLPGHTPGSAAWLVNGVLYFGDAATAGKDGGVLGPPFVFSDDVEQAKASLRALAGKIRPDDVKLFAFGHSAPMTADLSKLAAVK